MSSVNAVSYSLAARPDKVRFVIRGLEIDRAHQVYLRMMDVVTSTLGWSDEYASKHVKYNSYWYSEAVNGYTFQLSYKAATVVTLLPWYFAQHLKEIEVKSYVMFRDGDTSFGRYLDELSSTSPKYTSMVKQTGRYHNKQKTGYPRHQVLGSAKSDRSGVMYKRPHEYPGLELSVSGDMLKRLVTEVNGIYAGMEDDRYTQGRWTALLRKVGQAGYDYFEDDLVYRNVSLAKHAQYFTLATRDNDDGSVEPRYPIGENKASMHQADLMTLLNAFDAAQRDMETGE